jgi:hypothetical protein
MNRKLAKPPRSASFPRISAAAVWFTFINLVKAWHWATRDYCPDRFTF